MDANESKTLIAIVEDDQLVREALIDCMESGGYAAEGFASAEDWLASPSGRTAGLGLAVACLVLDIRLPGVTGLELQRRLGKTGGPPIVFVTANATDENRRMASILGAKGFLSKPVRRQDLLNIVRAAIPS